MTRLLATTMLALGLGCTPAAAQPAGGHTPPGERPKAQIIFETKEYNFGEIFDDLDVETTFKFHNAGDADLVIERVDSSCGCTVPELDKWVYAPGESGEIHVAYDTEEGMYADTRRKLTVHSNDYRNKPFVVELVGRVLPIAFARPSIVFFKGVPKGEPASATFEIAGRTDDFKVTGMSVTNTELFTLSVLNEKPTRGRFNEVLRGTTIEVAFKGHPEVAEFDDTIRVTTNDPRRPVIEIPVSTTIMGDIEMRPPVMRLRPKTTDEPGQGRVMLRHKSGEAFKILSIETTPGSLMVQTSIETLDPEYGVGYVIAVDAQAAAGTPPGDAESEIVFHTDVPGEGPIRLPVRMRVVRDMRNPGGLPAPLPASGGQGGG